jgi:hypothetical protein
VTSNIRSNGDLQKHGKQPHVFESLSATLDVAIRDKIVPKLIENVFSADALKSELKHLRHLFF